MLSKQKATQSAKRSEKSETPRERSIAADIFDCFELFAFAACAIFILCSFVVCLCRVDGDSMVDTLHDGELLLVSDVFSDVERGDIIVFHQTGTVFNEPIVKRVVSTGGEWVHIELDEATGRLVVTVSDENGENPVTLDEDYAVYDPTYASYRANYGYPVDTFVPEGSLYVMGDNRDHSSDSRSPYIGLVDKRRVLGKVVYRLTPTDKIGAVE